MKSIRKRTLIPLSIALLLLLSPNASGATPRLVINKLSAGLYQRVGSLGVVFEGQNIANTGFVVGGKCIAVIDTGGSPAEGKALRTAIEAISDRPICYVINTHGHPDHFLGNSAFADIPDLQIVAHQSFAQDTAMARQTWLGRLSVQHGEAAAAGAWLMPNTPVLHSMHLQLGGRELLLHTTKTAHSSSDLTVFDTQSGSLWLSDLLFEQHTPVLAGSLLGWIDVLQTLPTAGVQLVIPGHGQTSDEWPSASLRLQMEYLQQLKQDVKQRIDDGDSLFESQQQAVESSSEHWQLYPQYHPRNVTRAWQELEWE